MYIRLDQMVSRKGFVANSLGRLFIFVVISNFYRVRPRKRSLHFPFYIWYLDQAIQVPATKRVGTRSKQVALNGGLVSLTMSYFR